MDDMQNDILQNNDMNFEIPINVLDEIQLNIQSIIENFDIPEDNKFDVLSKINQMCSQTKQLTLTDALTGLYNRRHFENAFIREFARAKRYKAPLSVAIIDIDYFKKINDNYGHTTGDYVLKEIAYKIMSAFRLSDMIFRYGGEEFAVILSDTPLSEAQIPLERLRNAIEETEFNIKQNRIKTTISVGVAEISDEISSCYELFDLADKQLYQAKENGRNQVK